MIEQSPHKNFISARTNSPAKLSEHKLQNASEIYSQFFNGSSVPILILSSDLQIKYANSAADKFFNFLPTNSKARYFKDCVTADSLHKVNAAIKDASPSAMHEKWDELIQVCEKCPLYEAK